MRALPPIWPDGSLRQQIADYLDQTHRCVVVLDDDPTGGQTVHGVWELARWTVDDLRTALARSEPAFYILTNSRSMPLTQAQAVNREIAANLTFAARAEGRPITVVSRSDSTLRGHYPGEVEALAEALNQAQGAPFDGLCIIPFFPEGGRFTIHGVHWVQEGDMLIPVAQTPYARDAAFGYHRSRLADWVEEKTDGRVRASQVQCVSLDLLRCAGPAAVAERLREAEGGQVIVVDAVHYRDLEVFVSGMLRAEAAGKRFLFRTAASFVKVAAAIADRPLLTAEELVGTRPSGGGLLVFGSHVPKSSAQLAAVQALPGIASAELPVSQVLDDAAREPTIARVTAQVDAALATKRDALLFTSRELVTGRGGAANLSIGQSVSSALVEVVRRLQHEPRYVLGKGGITASDLATSGMDVRAARVLGQILAGVPVWQLGPHSRWPGMAYVVFPGNVGQEDSVAHIVRVLRG